MQLCSLLVYQNKFYAKLKEDKTQANTCTMQQEILAT